MGIFDTWRQNISKQLSTTGSIFSVPNLGLSQGIAQTPNKPVQPSFGLRPMPSFSAYAADNTGQMGPAAGHQYNTTLSSEPAPTGNLGGGGGGAGGGGQVLGGQTGGGYEIPQPQGGGVDFDALIAPAIQALDSYIPALQQGYESTVSDIGSAKEAQLQKSRSGITQQEGAIGKARTQQEQYGTSAADQARRGFAEIQQGLQSRYGRTTGTGAFASEIAGRETLGNISQIYQGVSTALKDLDDKLFQVKEIGRISELDIENNARQQVNQAKSQLDSQLADIRRQKGELQGRKAELAANAIQLYQQTVNQVNAQNAQFKQQLYLQQQDAENKIKTAMSKGSQIVESFTPFNANFGGQMTPVMTSKQGSVRAMNPAFAIPGNSQSFGAPKEDEFVDRGF